MYTASLIRRHINRLSVGQLFTSRDCLIYGSRGAVDQALFRLVKQDRILRLARGVFAKAGTRRKDISVLQVAKVKAESFGKQLATWAGDLAHDLGFAIEKEHARKIYSTDGSSSSFKYGLITVCFRRTCARKMHFRDNSAGKVVKSLWHLGRRNVTHPCVANASTILGRTDRDEIRVSLAWLPSWLGSFFLNRTLLLSFLKDYPPRQASLLDIRV